MILPLVSEVTNNMFQCLFIHSLTLLNVEKSIVTSTNLRRQKIILIVIILLIILTITTIKQ